MASALKKVTWRFLIAGGILLIAAIGLSVIWNRAIKNELALQASSFIRKGISSKEMRGVVEYLSGVQFSAFDHVSLYLPNREHIITLPPIFDQKSQKEQIHHQLLKTEVQVPIFWDLSSQEVLAIAVFSYSRFELVPYAVLIWMISLALLSIVFLQSRNKVATEFQKHLKLQKAEMIEEVAKKVRHNIRSPLASLRAIFLERSLSVESHQDQGISVIHRLEEIVDELKPEFFNSNAFATHPKNQQKALYSVIPLLSAVTSEKKWIAKNVTIEFSADEIAASQGIYTPIPEAEFKAMLSNIIDNSLQAISDQGGVEVLLTYDEFSFSIDVIDDGSGISPEILPLIFDKDFTHGKIAGSGLGLYYAKKLVESHLGNITMTSTVGQGSRLSMILPRSPTPPWHVDQLPLKDHQRIVVIDDQVNMHQMWRMKIAEAGINIQSHFFLNCEEATEWLKTEDGLDKGTLFLVDYDLGSGKINGLEWLEDHPQLAANFILITGHYDDPAVQSRCAQLGCRMRGKV
ncbi:MAG: ATP-binding protein [Pseudobdellovibrionaceae bacterium]